MSNMNHSRMTLCTLTAVAVVGLLAGCADTAVPPAGGTRSGNEHMLAAANIRIRDPFILTKGGTYYLVAAKDEAPRGVQVYESADLRTWRPPRQVLTIPASWDCTAVWAPEMHEYRGRYYLFVTLTFGATFPDGTKTAAAGANRGTWIFRADTISGPFHPLKNASHTPKDWMSLDGTLFVEDGHPYLVFCHEWLQTKDGTMERLPLTDDLSDVAGRPVTLFRGSAVSNAKSGNYVTDGPFLFHQKDGSLNMLWSTFREESGYCLVQATSASGKIAGPWNRRTIVFRADGGHGMLFRTKDGVRKLVIHQPNRGPDERMKIIDFLE